jgi:hypothetical protein
MIGGFERSLSGGLRYSVQGGSYQAYRDMFTWNVVPTVAEFQQAIENAFAAWTVTDPVTGIGTSLTFVANFATPVAGPAPNVPVNTAGAEIDLLAYRDAVLWNPGDPNTQGETFFDTSAFTTLTLTSGTLNYPGFAIAGADIKINSNPEAVYTLDFFRRLLTHEIGHALGLGDVEGTISPGRFIDDNFDGTSAATALATLTNPWAHLVNPLNPAASPLALYNIGTATMIPGVDILMESIGLGISPANPVTTLTPLRNDDYGTRQFLYPHLLGTAVPEPGGLALFGMGLLVLLGGGRRLARRSR